MEATIPSLIYQVPEPWLNVVNLFMNDPHLIKLEYVRLYLTA